MTASNQSRSVRRREFAQRCGFSLATLDRLTRSGQINPPLHLGPRIVVWPEDYVVGIVSGKIPLNQVTQSQNG